MRDILFNIRMYGSLLKMTIRGILQYRADFWMSLVSVALLNSANIVQLSVISWRFNTLDSWRIGDLLVLYGLFMLSWSIFSVFFFKLSKIEEEIVNGTFDVYLLRPVSPLLQLTGGDLNYPGLCDALLGAALISMGLAMTGMRWELWHVLWLVIFVLSGGTIAVCCKFLIACVSFWTTKASALQSIFIQLYLLTQKYPITIFGRPFRVLVTGLVPIAFLNFYPAVYLLGKEDVPSWLCMMAPVMAGLMAGIAALVWRRGLHRYNSCGG